MRKLIELNPSQAITFLYTKQASCKSTLQLRNVSSDNVSFKIKTTAPQFYVVKPNQGILEANQRAELIITMQASSQKFPSAEHKFLIQTMICPANFLNNPDNNQMITMWKNAPKQDISQNKLKVILKEKFQETVDRIQEVGMGEEVTPPKRGSLTQEANSPSNISPSALLDKYNTLYHKLQESKEAETELKNENEKLKDKQISLEQKQTPTVENIPEKHSGFGFIHIIIVAVIFLVIGAFLGSNN